MPLLCTSWCGYDEGVSIHSSLVALVIDVTKCIVYTQRLCNVCVYGPVVSVSDVRLTSRRFETRWNMTRKVLLNGFF